MFSDTVSLARSFKWYDNNICFGPTDSNQVELPWPCFRVTGASGTQTAYCVLKILAIVVVFGVFYLFVFNACHIHHKDYAQHSFCDHGV